MSTLLKDIFSKPFLESFADDLLIFLPALNSQDFIVQVLNKEWEKRELKQRMRHITTVLNQFLPQDFSETANILNKLILH